MEELITDNRVFFERTTSAIDNAQNTIDCEVYILAKDEIGECIFNAFLQAASRGVKVRLVVDGIGSAIWINEQDFSRLPSNLEIRVFHPLPFAIDKPSALDHLKFAKAAISRLNRRNHKKLLIVDDKEVISGSHNYWANSLHWNEVGVRVKGDCSYLKSSFEYSWKKSTNIKSHFQKPHLVHYKSVNEKPVSTNMTFRQRKQFLTQLIDHIDDAQQNIWLVTPYFVPPTKLLNKLCKAAHQGVDVRLVLPLQCDHLFMRFAARYYYPKMIASGVKIYEYEPRMLHAKLFSIDQWAALGSTNLNHRSFFYDLELLITLRDTNARHQLHQLFLSVFQTSHLIDQQSGFTPPLLESIMSKIIFAFRKWI